MRRIWVALAVAACGVGEVSGQVFTLEAGGGVAEGDDGLAPGWHASLTASPLESRVASLRVRHLRSGASEKGGYGQAVPDAVRSSTALLLVLRTPPVRFGRLHWRPWAELGTAWSRETGTSRLGGGEFDRSDAGAAFGGGFEFGWALGDGWSAEAAVGLLRLRADPWDGGARFQAPLASLGVAKVFR